MCCCLVRKWRYNLKFCFVCAIEKRKSESTFFKGGSEWNGFSLVITLVEFVNSVRHLMNEWGPWDVVLSGKREIDFTEMQQHCPDFLSHATVNHIINWRIKKSCCRLLKYERCLRALKKFYSHQRDKKVVTRRCYKRRVNWNQTMCDAFNICINEIWGIKMSAFHLFMTQVTSTSPCNKGIATVLIVNTWWIL